ncbi:Golgin subfamily a member, partial [Thalictrum thalictroides]
HIDHSARVMRVITWNRSFRGMPNAGDGKDDFDAEEHETHATVLDKLLAWEKKLYDEVKVCAILIFNRFSLYHLVQFMMI